MSTDTNTSTETAVRIVRSLDGTDYRVTEVANIGRKLGSAGIRNRTGNIEPSAVCSRDRYSGDRYSGDRCSGDSIEREDIRKRTAELREQTQVTSQEIITLSAELLVLILWVVVALIGTVIVFAEVLLEIDWYTYVLLKSFISSLFVFFEALYQDESVPELLVNTVTTGGSLIPVPILYPGVSGALYFDRMNITEFLDRYKDLYDIYRVGEAEKLCSLLHYCEVTIK